jgi:hypothetical protein
VAWFKKDKGVNWLHISDFHFKEDASYDSDVVARALLQSLPALKERFGNTEMVFATGDVAFSGRAAESSRRGA